MPCRLLGGIMQGGDDIGKIQKVAVKMHQSNYKHNKCRHEQTTARKCCIKSKQITEKK